MLLAPSRPALCPPQDYYPELMWKCVIVNAPTTFRIIWGMVKYLMDARTQAKIEVGVKGGGGERSS